MHCTLAVGEYSILLLVLCCLPVPCVFICWSFSIVAYMRHAQKMLKYLTALSLYMPAIWTLTTSQTSVIACLFFYGKRNYAVTAQHRLYVQMKMNSELERLWKEVAVWFKVSSYLPEGTRVNHKNLSQTFPNCAPRSTKCSAKHLQVLRKELERKIK
jgi:hypothetical protein